MANEVMYAHINLHVDVGKKGLRAVKELNHRAAVAVRHTGLPLFVKLD